MESEKGIRGEDEIRDRLELRRRQFKLEDERRFNTMEGYATHREIEVLEWVLNNDE